MSHTRQEHVWRTGLALRLAKEVPKKVFFLTSQSYNKPFYFLGPASDSWSNLSEVDLDSRVIHVQGEQILLSVTVLSFSWFKDVLVSFQELDETFHFLVFYTGPSWRAQGGALFSSLAKKCCQNPTFLQQIAIISRGRILEQHCCGLVLTIFEIKLPPEPSSWKSRIIKDFLLEIWCNSEEKPAQTPEH